MDGRRRQGPRHQPRPVHGRDAVARLLVAVASNADESYEIRYRRVNGDPSALLFTGDAPFAVLVLDIAPNSNQVQGVYSVTNPDKLIRISAE